MAKKNKTDDQPKEQLSYKKNELLPSVAPTRMHFKSWFINLLNSDPRIKQHHFEQLRVFMLGYGLSEFEEATRYTKALKTYFGE